MVMTGDISNNIAYRLLQGASLLKRLFYVRSTIIPSVAAHVCAFTDCFFDPRAVRCIFAPAMVHEASFTGALRIIFWILLVSFIIRLVVRLATPYVVKKSEDVLRRRMEEFQNQQRQQNQPRRNEGEVTIESRKPPKDDGEFTDYVEIKE